MYLDASFSTDGWVNTAVSATSDDTRAIGVLSDGRIVVVGISHNGTNHDVEMVRSWP